MLEVQAAKANMNSGDKVMGASKKEKNVLLLPPQKVYQNLRFQEQQLAYPSSPVPQALPQPTFILRNYKCHCRNIFADVFVSDF